MSLRVARHVASAISRAPPATAAARILSPSGLEASWLGSVKIEAVDADWPSVGSHMRWRSGGVFDAEVAESALPGRIVFEVQTPSGRSTITSTFEPTQEGGTRYTKVVETRPAGLMGRLFDLMLSGIVKREVKRAAAYADKAD